MFIDVIPHANYPVRAGAIAVFFTLTLLKVGDVFSYLLAKTLQIFVAGCTIRPPYFLLPRFPFPHSLPHSSHSSSTSSFSSASLSSSSFSAHRFLQTYLMDFTANIMPIIPIKGMMVS